jgi:hypothetical protein
MRSAEMSGPGRLRDRGRSRTPATPPIRRGGNAQGRRTPEMPGTPPTPPSEATTADAEQVGNRGRRMNDREGARRPGDEKGVENCALLSSWPPRITRQFSSSARTWENEGGTRSCAARPGSCSSHATAGKREPQRICGVVNGRIATGSSGWRANPGSWMRSGRRARQSPAPGARLRLARSERGFDLPRRFAASGRLRDRQRFLEAGDGAGELAAARDWRRIDVLCRPGRAPPGKSAGSRSAARRPAVPGSAISLRNCPLLCARR